MIELTSLAAEYDAFRYRMSIEGVEYLLRFEWVARASAWYLALAEPDGTDAGALIRRIKLVVGVRLLRGARDPRLPAGDLLLVDVSGQSRDIEQREDLGGRVRLLYVSADELAAIDDALASSSTLTFEVL